MATNRFNEQDHPRDETGKFIDKGAGESSNAQALIKDIPDLGAQDNITESSDARQLQRELPKSRNKQIEPFKTKEELLSFMQEDANISLEEAEKVHAAIYDYTCKEYENIRDGLRPDLVKTINDYLKTATKFSGKVYRGLSFTEEKAEEFLKKYPIGKIFNDNILTSWSDSFEQAERYSNFESKPVRVIIETESKTGVGIKHISKRPRETEVLFSTKSIFFVKNMEKHEKLDSAKGKKYTLYRLIYEEIEE